MRFVKNALKLSPTLCVCVRESVFVFMCVFTITRGVPWSGSYHTGVLGKLRPCKQEEMERAISMFLTVGPCHLLFLLFYFTSWIMNPAIRINVEELVKKWQAVSLETWQDAIHCKLNLKKMLPSPTTAHRIKRCLVGLSGEAGKGSTSCKCSLTQGNEKQSLRLSRVIFFQLNTVKVLQTKYRKNRLSQVRFLSKCSSTFNQMFRKLAEDKW